MPVRKCDLLFMALCMLVIASGVATAQPQGGTMQVKKGLSNTSTPPVQPENDARQFKPVRPEPEQSKSYSVIQPPDGAQIIYPEVPNRLKLSNSDVNRFVCPEKFKDAVFSKEKGITVRYTGRDAFVKFLMEIRLGEKRYITTPAEIFFVCGEATYNVIAEPTDNIPSQTIYLSSGKQDNIRKNNALYNSMPFEEKILSIIQNIYRDSIPESYTVTKIGKPINRFRDIDITLIRIVEIEGEGLAVKDFKITLKHPPLSKPGILSSLFKSQDKPLRSDLSSSDAASINIQEKDFLMKDFMTNPAAIAIDKHTLTLNSVSRLLVVEKTEESK